ncbi:MAG: HAMP domain-containing histidine kinase [Ignavibacteria bacterium]|nr:HAMP domain-containing histidine kinase [Ignavibacteria bacterium]
MTTFSIEFVNYLNSIFNYCKRISNEERLSDVIDEAIDIFLQFPYAQSVGYYFLNKDSFLFDFKKSSDPKEDSFYLNVLPKLIESGEIGNAVSSRTIVCKEDREDGAKLFIVPIFATSFVSGLVLIKTKYDSPSLEVMTANLTILFSNLLGYYFSNLILDDENKRHQDLLEQIVASRTIDIQKKSLMVSEKLENLKNDLIMSIPHEVRTPLNAIIGFSDYLINYASSPQASEWKDVLEILSDIKNSASRLKRFFENYIQYAQLVLISSNINEIRNVQNKKTLTVEPIIFDVAHSIAKSYSREADVCVNIVDSAIVISEEYFTKIIEELIDNAFKFSKAGSKVEITSYIKKNVYVLSIKDYGRGMTEEEIKDIDTYIQFQRDKYEQQGTGLGLSIARKIIDLYNANIFIKSEKHAYTEITVEFQTTQIDYPL